VTRVFVSYSSDDKYFVDFLVELLAFHHIEVWVDRNDLNAGANFASDIDRALASCDSLIAVISQHSLNSPWMTREISVFKTANPDGMVIPVVLAAEVDINEVYSGLGQIQQIRCYESMLESFKELLRLLDRSLFPHVERRSTSDRRYEDRRQADRRAGTDRRTGRIEARLRVGINKGYSAVSGRGEFQPLEWMNDVGRFVRFLDGPDSPLLSFDFVDRKTGEPVLPDFQTLETMAFKSWESNSREGLHGIVYIIDDIVRELTNAYVVTWRDRREEERRAGERRTAERRSGDKDS
jgi:TIR domain